MGGKKRKIFEVLLTFAVVLGVFTGMDMDARASEIFQFTQNQNGTVSCNYEYKNGYLISGQKAIVQCVKPDWLQEGEAKINTFKFRNGNIEMLCIEDGSIIQGISYLSYFKIRCWLQIDVSPYSSLSSDHKWKIIASCDYDEDNKVLNWNIVAELYNGTEPLSEPVKEVANQSESLSETIKEIANKSGGADNRNVFLHTHSYSWVTVQEATSEQDGIEEYRCSCGDVQERNVIPASEVLVKGLFGEIKDAPLNGTTTFDTGRQYTLSDYIIRKLSERTDVTTVITFEYEGQSYCMTIPAGADYSQLLADEEYFYGYFYFANAVGAKIEAL